MTARVPILHGQPREMLARALRQYAAGERRSGIMQPAASGLSERAIEALARFYSELPRPAVPLALHESDAGRKLTERGDASAEIPACRGCHNAQALPIYPRLEGQPEIYLRTRLEQMRGGANAATPTGAIMSAIARRLNDRQIKEAARFFATADPKEGPAP